MIFHGLKARTDLNGCFGTLDATTKDCSGRYAVTVDSPAAPPEEATAVKAKPCNIFPATVATAASWTWCTTQQRAVVLFVDESAEFAAERSDNASLGAATLRLF